MPSDIIPPSQATSPIPSLTLTSAPTALAPPRERVQPSTDASWANGLSALQLRYIGYALSGQRPGAIQQHLDLDDLTLFTWRQDGRFARAEAEVRTLCHTMGPAIARRILAGASVGAALRLAHEIDHATYERDRIAAANSTLDRAGVTGATRNPDEAEAVDALTRAYRAWRAAHGGVAPSAQENGEVRPASNET